jgi:CheY-like chemotaxis protein
MQAENTPSTASSGDASFKSVSRRRLLHLRPVVLVVDDDRDARAIYGLYLRAKGCRVVTAPDGMAAITRAVRHRPDVIIMDLAMPRLDGWAATRRLKRRRVTAGTPIIALSAVDCARDSARAAGCDAFLAKPCLPELLWCEIRVVLHDTGSMWGEMAGTTPPRRWNAS